MASLTLKAGGFSPRGLWRSYERALRRSPVATQAVTSAALWGLGDALAQRIEGPSPRSGPDLRRVALTAAFGGAVIGPLGHAWYLGLDQLVLRLGLAGTRRAMLLKVLVDNLVYSPAYVAAFFAFGSVVIDGISARQLGAKMRRELMPTLIAEALVWPPYMALVFGRVPVQHQLLAVNVATLFDVCFLSWARTHAQPEPEPDTCVSASAEHVAEHVASEAEHVTDLAAAAAHVAALRRQAEEQESRARERLAAAAEQEEGRGGVRRRGGRGRQQQQQQQQQAARSANDEVRRELAACLWDATPETSLGARALMAASVTGGGAAVGGWW
ncbi:hypothetical protein HYH03_014204 [Edaphochlamys debaryana]|uniref:Uncharacterized protein n=1 Tax=Edaphochlamys debaryana TaxID=47281 RepID=A0A835XLW1_9CHLO|nr:hypothetical protein HYH03_014204 [Edaphochlamys debaryana]|eukprot:KAG2487232.1 hypothetical protein HYH03_014204 [Edaphochlamys debaryana]